MPGEGVIVAYDATGVPRRVLVDANGRVLLGAGGLAIGSLTPPSIFAHGNRTTNAGTAVALTAATTTCSSVLITAMVTNTGYVYIGGAAVSAANYGKRLASGAWVKIDIDDLAKVFFDVSVNGEGVTFLYVV